MGEVISALCPKRQEVPQSMIPGESRKMGSADSKDPMRNQSTLFDLFPIPSIILDLDSDTILDSNQAFSELTGSSATDPISPAFLRSIKEATSRNIPIPGQPSFIGLEIPDRNGRLFPVEIDYRPILRDGRNCLLLTFRDTSEFERRLSILHLIGEAGKDFFRQEGLDLFFDHLQRGLEKILPVRLSFLSFPSSDGSLKLSGAIGRDRGDQEMIVSHFSSFRWDSPDGLESDIGKAVATGKIQSTIPEVQAGSALSSFYKKTGVTRVFTLPFGQGERNLPFGL